jgi:hypothetical protein
VLMPKNKPAYPNGRAGFVYSPFSKLDGLADRARAVVLGPSSSSFVSLVIIPVIVLGWPFFLFLLNNDFRPIAFGRTRLVVASLLRESS